MNENTIRVMPVLIKERDVKNFPGLKVDLTKPEDLPTITICPVKDPEHLERITAAFLAARITSRKDGPVEPDGDVNSTKVIVTEESPSYGTNDYIHFQHCIGSHTPDADDVQRYNAAINEEFSKVCIDRDFYENFIVINLKRGYECCIAKFRVMLAIGDLTPMVNDIFMFCNDKIWEDFQIIDEKQYMIEGQLYTDKTIREYPKLKSMILSLYLSMYNPSYIFVCDPDEAADAYKILSDIKLDPEKSRVKGIMIYCGKKEEEDNA